MLKKCAVCTGKFYFTYITVDFKKLVSDLFHDSSALVESESIKSKTRLSDYPRNITIASKPSICNVEAPCNASV